MGLRYPQKQEPIDEFELMRRRIQGRGGQRADAAQRDVQRQFARLGNLDSGTALSISQQTAQAQEDLTNQQTEGVNILEAQVRQQERETAKDREVQRYGIDTQSQTSRYGVDVGARSALDVANIGEAGATTRARIGTDSAERIAKVGHETAMAIAKLEAETNISLQNTSLAQAKTIAEWDVDLRKQGLSIQKMVADNGIEQSKLEGTLNTAATFINSFEVLKNAGFDLNETKRMFEALGLKVGWDQIQLVIDSKIAKDSPPFVPQLGQASIY